MRQMSLVLVSGLTLSSPAVGGPSCQEGSAPGAPVLVEEPGIFPCTDPNG